MSQGILLGPGTSDYQSLGYLRISRDVPSSDNHLSQVQVIPRIPWDILGYPMMSSGQLPQIGYIGPVTWTQGRIGNSYDVPGQPQDYRNVQEFSLASLGTPRVVPSCPSVLSYPKNPRDMWWQSQTTWHLHSPFDSPRNFYHNNLLASADRSNASTHFYYPYRKFMLAHTNFKTQYLRAPRYTVYELLI